MRATGNFMNFLFTREAFGKTVIVWVSKCRRRLKKNAGNFCRGFFSSSFFVYPTLNSGDSKAHTFKFCTKAPKISIPTPSWLLGHENLESVHVVFHFNAFSIDFLHTLTSYCWHIFCPTFSHKYQKAASSMSQCLEITLCPSNFRAQLLTFHARCF
jgi:hypothetical protein